MAHVVDCSEKWHLSCTFLPICVRRTQAYGSREAVHSNIDPLNNDEGEAWSPLHQGFNAACQTMQKQAHAVHIRLHTKVNRLTGPFSDG